MTVHAAFGGSTNLLLHLTAIAHAAGLRRPTVDDWTEVNQSVPRLVDALPNGPVGHATVRVFLAGGVPEVMLHLRHRGLLDLDCLTVAGERLGRVLDWWEGSERRQALRERLRAVDGVDPDEVIMDPERARQRGLTSTVTFPRGNLAPEGSVIKSTAIDPSVVDADGVYRKTGPARVFTSERAAIAAIKSRGADGIKPGDVMVLICRGPLGAGMEEIYQITAALKHLSFGKHVAVLTDARFSGVSTGACVGHVGPEALAGGPIGRVLDGDLVRIVVDRNRLVGSVDLVGRDGVTFGAEEGARVLAARAPRADLAPDPDLPDDTRLWAALQQVGGGTWGGCVYDVDAIISSPWWRTAIRAHLLRWRGRGKPSTYGKYASGCRALAASQLDPSRRPTSRVERLTSALAAGLERQALRRRGWPWWRGSANLASLWLWIVMALLFLLLRRWRGMPMSKPWIACSRRMRGPRRGSIGRLPPIRDLRWPISGARGACSCRRGLRRRGKRRGALACWWRGARRGSAGMSRRSPSRWRGMRCARSPRLPSTSSSFRATRWCSRPPRACTG